MLFTKYKKDLCQELYAPVTGDIILLEDVPDKIFSHHLMGGGVAINPRDQTIYAPCNGEVIAISSGSHALGITCDNGYEILIHVGVETASLSSSGFEILTRINDYVNTGTPLLKFNLHYLYEKGLCPYVILILIENSDYYLSNITTQTYVQASQDLICIIKEK